MMAQIRRRGKSNSLSRPGQTHLNPNSEAEFRARVVAQASKPAVSQVSKLAGRGSFRALRQCEGLPTWKSATRQVWKPALPKEHRPASKFGLKKNTASLRRPCWLKLKRISDQGNWRRFTPAPIPPPRLLKTPAVRPKSPVLFNALRKAVVLKPCTLPSANPTLPCLE